MPAINTVVERKPDPLTRSNFVVDFGQGPMGFAEVILPASRAEVISYREGDERVGTARLFPGRISYGPVVLRRGSTPSNDFFVWWKTVQDGQPARRDVTISVLDAQRNTVKRFRLIQAWPSRFQPGPLNAKDDDVFMEELELSFERFEADLQVGK